MNLEGGQLHMLIPVAYCFSCVFYVHRSLRAFTGHIVSPRQSSHLLLTFKVIEPLILIFH